MARRASRLDFTKLGQPKCGFPGGKLLVLKNVAGFEYHKHIFIALLVCKSVPFVLSASANVPMRRSEVSAFDAIEALCCLT